MRKNYKAPELEIIELEITDIIRTSGGQTEQQSLNVNSVSKNSNSYTYSDVVTGNTDMQIMNLFE